MADASAGPRATLGTRSYWVVAGPLVVMATLFAPMTLSYDGHEYVRSGFAVLEGRMTEHYQWLREPGYPVFAAGALLLGGTRLLILLQGVILTGAVHIVWRSVDLFLVRPHLRAAWGLVPLVFIWGYSTAVLQQPLILLGTSLVTLALASLWCGRAWLVPAVVGGLVLGVVSTVATMGALAAVAVLLLVTLVARSSRAPAVAGLAAVLIATSLVTVGGWYAFKATQDTTRSDAFGRGSVLDYAAGGPTYLSERVALVPSTLLGLSSAGVEFVVDASGSSWSAPAKENREFGLPEFAPGASCTRVFPEVSELQPLGPRAEEAVRGCVPPVAVAVVTKVDHVLFLALPGVAAAALVAALALLVPGGMVEVRPGFRSVILLPFLFTAPYLWVGAGISRYGLPMLVTNLLCLTVLLQAAWSTSRIPKRTVGSADTD